MCLKAEFYMFDGNIHPRGEAHCLIVLFSVSLEERTGTSFAPETTLVFVMAD